MWQAILAAYILFIEGGIAMPKGSTETKTLKVGDKAPDFTLKAHGNRTVTLSEYLGKKNVFIAFYPLDWTPN
jgi:peroxiredoxin